MVLSFSAHLVTFIIVVQQFSKVRRFSSELNTCKSSALRQFNLYQVSNCIFNCSKVVQLQYFFFAVIADRKQRSMANSGFERGLESAREIEFSFFKIIYMLAKRQLPNLTDEPSDSSIDQLANIMDAHNKLLSAILDLNVYQPSNNEAADQYVFMSTSFGSIYSCLTMAQTLNNGRLQRISLTGIVALAQLDDRLLKPHLDSLWPILLCPLAGAHDAALELAKTLLEIYSKSSDLQIFLLSLLSVLQGFVTRPQELHSSPLFTRAFLDL